MPTVRISLLKGKHPEYLRELADTVYDAMHDAFNVPEGDQFVMIHQLQPEEFVFNRHYLGGPRSDDFVLIAITIGRPRDSQTRQAFYRRLNALLGERLGIASEDVMVQITNSEADDWSFGGGRMGVLTKPDALSAS
ncbi:tautomerase family protein [Pseudomonas nitroreducens]|uniref:tautomerase family protein n=1 Tax=Pseudomonas nitroreducens TaxID=46680 RepID=UPI00209FC25E|nr:tautomerase family protein [Pseudomonas nitroreducens]MCP1625573.1 phenylpyruvate tautomerase PptA (4-oxalocrotonate tautomerase family) [Pseudomonas nitroreducens]